MSRLVLDWISLLGWNDAPGLGTGDYALAADGGRSSATIGVRRSVAIAVGMALTAGTALALYTTLPGPGHNATLGTNQELAAEAAARTQAINWIVQQVSRTAIVSCDQQVCADLVNSGFPSETVLPLGNLSTDVLGSTMVVATAAVRAQFDGRLASLYAPVVIASFGSGNAEIEIRQVFPDGTAAYRAAERRVQGTGRNAPTLPDTMHRPHVLLAGLTRDTAKGGLWTRESPLQGSCDPCSGSDVRSA